MMGFYDRHEFDETSVAFARAVVRFHDKYTPEPNSGCWFWDHAITPDNYAHHYIGIARVSAHRFSYFIHNGPFIKDMEIHHTCDIRFCVNPDHLVQVSHAYNMAQGRRAKQTHCKRGHPLAGNNLYITPDGRRNCIRCRSKAVRRNLDEKRRIHRAIY